MSLFKILQILEEYHRQDKLRQNDENYRKAARLKCKMY
jgi:hypothetical protein